MPISVDTIRGLTSKYVVFDSQREALDKASVGHHIANFFGSKAAKSVNRETMNAIKNAVLSESRYFGIRERANWTNQMDLKIHFISNNPFKIRRTHILFQSTWNIL